MEESSVLITDKDIKVTVLDAEVVYPMPLSTVQDQILDMSKLNIYVFDVIVLKNKNLAHYGFETRYTEFKEVQKILDMYTLGSLKKFVKLDKSNYK